jgi:hypothetical protein
MPTWSVRWFANEKPEENTTASWSKNATSPNLYTVSDGVMTTSFSQASAAQSVQWTRETASTITAGTIIIRAFIAPNAGSGAITGRCEVRLNGTTVGKQAGISFANQPASQGTGVIVYRDASGVNPVLTVSAGTHSYRLTHDGSSASLYVDDTAISTFSLGSDDTNQIRFEHRKLNTVAFSLLRTDYVLYTLEGAFGPDDLPLPFDVRLLRPIGKKTLGDEILLDPVDFHPGQTESVLYSADLMEPTATVIFSYKSALADETESFITIGSQTLSNSTDTTSTQSFSWVVPDLAFGHYTMSISMIKGLQTSTDFGWFEVARPRGNGHDNGNVEFPLRGWIIYPTSFTKLTDSFNSPFTGLQTISSGGGTVSATFAPHETYYPSRLAFTYSFISGSTISTINVRILEGEKVKAEGAIFIPTVFGTTSSQTVTMSYSSLLIENKTYSVELSVSGSAIVSIGTGSGLSFKLLPNIPQNNQVVMFHPERFRIRMPLRVVNQYVPHSTFSGFFFYNDANDNAQRIINIDARVVGEYDGFELQKHLASLSVVKEKLTLQSDYVTYSVRFINSTINREGTEKAMRFSISVVEEPA